MTHSEIKLIFTGSTNAGKTTAIGAISEIPVNHTYMNMVEPANTVHKEAMAAVGYGELTLENGRKLRLYDIPNQGRFESFRKILMKGAVGLVILIDNAGADPMGELARCIDRFRENINTMETVIGITHTDVVSTPDLQSYQTYLQQRGIKLPLLLIDARHRDNVIRLIQIITNKII